jgi:hypothetical protein
LQNVKTFRLLLVLAAVIPLATPHASAQTTAVVRGDVAGTLGTQVVNTGDTNRFLSNRRFEGGFYGAASAGWYWTEHVRTQLDFGARTKGRSYIPYPVVIGGAQTYYASDRTFSRQTVGIGQQYQFFHNAWFHPYLGAGANLTWERSRLHTAAAYAYDPATRLSRVVSPERTGAPQRDFFVNPFVESGFKAYMTPRTFFRGDLRVAFRHGVDDVVTRFGFGFDF